MSNFHREKYMRLWGLEETLVFCPSVGHSLSCSTISPNPSPTLVLGVSQRSANKLEHDYVGLLTD